MNPQKQFTGFLSSSASPGDLSLTISSLTQAVIWAAGTFAVMRGLDSQTITSQVQLIIDYSTTGVTAGLTLYHTGQTIWGLIRKLLYVVKAKSVVTVPTAVPSAVVTGS